MVVFKGMGLIQSVVTVIVTLQKHERCRNMRKETIEKNGPI